MDARGLTASFGARPVLRGVDLQVRQGELWVVLGPNGAGKSTLLRVLLGLHPRDGGEVRLFGREQASWSRRDLARRAAWVPQTFEPAFGFTGLELVTMGRSPHLGTFGLPAASDLRAGILALEALGVGYLADRPATSMSGGEQRLLVLARALVQAPDLLLLDEPTAFLDLRHQVECLQRVRERLAQGLAAVAVLHDVNLAAAFADRVLLLRDGRVLAHGPPRQTLNGPALEALYGVPMQVGQSADGQPLFAPRMEPAG